MIPGMNAPFVAVANVTGASVDEIKLIFSFLLSYPLAAVLKRIPDRAPWQKNMFNIAIALFYLVGLFDLWDGLRTILYDAVAIYAIAYYIDGTLMPWIGFVFLMSHMSISHIQRQILNDPGIVDVTGAQMVLLMKLSAFCWNVHDGRLKPEYLNEGQKERAVYEMPSLLDYAGYVLFFPSFMAGPAFDYVDYRRFLDTTMFDPPANGPGPPPNKKGRKIPRSGIPAFKKLVTGLVWLVAYLQLGTRYNVKTVLDESYMDYGLVRRVLILYGLGFTARTKYYAVWSMTEGACILSGIGYNGVDPVTKRIRWDKVENVNPWGIETAQNSRAYLEGWNENTNHWLRYYVYLRVTPKGKKPGFRASLTTFITSAFWHGFEPGYYLTFAMAAFVQTAAKNIRRYVRPFFLTPDGKQGTKYKIYYDVVCWFVTQFTYCFVTAPFLILGFNDCIKVWARVYFYALVGTLASIAFFASPGRKLLTKRLDKRNHPHIRRGVSQETIHPPALGLPNDPGREIDEAIEEIRAEVEARNRRGSTVRMPTGEELLKGIEDKIGKGVRINEHGRIDFDGVAVDLGEETAARQTAAQEKKKER
ncbi:hypothetical protein DV737_g2532, partial [Chaetothyriales sp. CBS 132003]